MLGTEVGTWTSRQTCAFSASLLRLGRPAIAARFLFSGGRLPGEPISVGDVGNIHNLRLDFALRHPCRQGESLSSGEPRFAPRG